MKNQKYPVLDDHIHIDPRNGRGIEAAKDFKRAGGTHICLVTKPSWSLGINPTCGNDFKGVFDETLSIARQIEEIGLVVFPILGVHPAEITVCTPRLSVAEAAEVMRGGLTCAARYVEEGKAAGLKSGRPHYEVPPEIMAASNEVLYHGLSLCRELGSSLQIHAESGPCNDIVDMARSTGMDISRVVKHFGSPETPLVPSLMAKHESIPSLCREGRNFTMESDYMDENSRPGAVIGPKSVPRFTNNLFSSGQISIEDIYRIHKETPEKVYGIEITL
jgi:TatD-related deoxyribonuclease